MIVPVVGEEQWLSLLAAMPTWQPPLRPTVVIAPHPDDETLGAGGLIASLREAGCEVRVVAVTDGENCYPGEDPRTERIAEQTAALAALGVDAAHITRLHLPDSGLTRHEDEVYERLLAVCPEGVQLIAPWEHDFHPDHEVCGRAAKRVAQTRHCTLQSYLFWTWHRGTPELLRDLPFTRFLLSAGQRAAKRAALLCHQTQLHHPGGDPILPENLLEPAWRETEVFLATWDPGRTSVEFFEAKYQADPDPWQFATDNAELFRYRTLLGMLGKPHFRHAFEPACSVGVLTAQLAERCDRVTASDVSATALAKAAQRCDGLPQVHFQQASVTDLQPRSDTDLLLLSEIGYYFPRGEWAQLVEVLAAAVQPGCTLVAGHWTGQSPDHILSGDEVHAALRENRRLRLEAEERHPQFRCDRFCVVAA